MLGDLSSVRSVKVGKKLLVLMLSIGSASCSVTQLKDQTVSVGRDVGPIYTSQVLENLYRLNSERNAVPSDFSITKGNANTSNSISPTLSLPLGNQVTRNFARNDIFGINGVVTTGRSLSLGTSEGWNQSWEIDPADNPKILELLRTVYLRVLGAVPDRDDLESAEGLSKLVSTITRRKTNPVTKPVDRVSRSVTSAIPTEDDTYRISHIYQVCEKTPGGCFRPVEGASHCIEPKELSGHSHSSDLDSEWVCLGQYNSTQERTLGHEMMITKYGYSKGLLFDLVMLSRQLQLEAAAGNSQPAKPGAGNR